jgi:hypothetical protein
MFNISSLFSGKVQNMNSSELDETFAKIAAGLEGGGDAILPMPADLLKSYADTQLTAEEKTALRAIIHLPFNTPPADAVAAFDMALAALSSQGFELADETGRAEKFDTFDAYFKINRTHDDPGRAYLYGLLASFRNVYAMLDPEGTLSVTELPLLRMALESALEMFEF